MQPDNHTPSSLSALEAAADKVNRPKQPHKPKPRKPKTAGVADLALATPPAPETTTGEHEPTVGARVDTGGATGGRGAQAHEDGGNGAIAPTPITAEKPLANARRNTPGNGAETSATPPSAPREGVDPSERENAAAGEPGTVHADTELTEDASVLAGAAESTRDTAAATSDPAPADGQDNSGAGEPDTSGARTDAAASKDSAGAGGQKASGSEVVAAQPLTGRGLVPLEMRNAPETPTMPDSIRKSIREGILTAIRGVNAAHETLTKRQRALVTALVEAREMRFPRSEVERIRGEAVSVGFTATELDHLLEATGWDKLT
ncbi:hypothetical protein [Amycolatopsis anabasis]|uniref:hypothetical protein n=1 Tax=Amycolatopsis anabasis TaxID=1840409 RepID=UPI00131C49DE|nr:hypothetical protein [Amycolatopsis anabasis]